MSISITTQMEETILQSIRQGNRIEYTLLLGQHASSLGFANEEGAVRRQIEKALHGQDPEVTKNVIKYVQDMMISKIDAELLKWFGLEIPVFMYLSSITFNMLRNDHDTKIISRIESLSNLNQTQKILNLEIGNFDKFDIDLSINQCVVIYAMPETIISAIAKKVDEKVLLKGIVSHPILDRYDLRIGKLQKENWGTILYIDDHHVFEKQKISDIYCGK